MEIELNQLSPGERYKVLASLVAPRPIAWVTTVDGLGRVNAAPFSFFNVFGMNPPMVAFAPGNRKKAHNGEAPVLKDTARNIRETGEFVVHLLEENLATAMAATAEPMAPGDDELLACGLSTIPSLTVKPPRIAEAPVALECREHQTIEVGENRLVLGIISQIFVRDGLIDPVNWSFSPDQWAPVGRMASPGWYCRTENLYELPGK